VLAGATALGVAAIHAPVVPALLVPTLLGAAIVWLACRICHDPDDPQGGRRMLRWAYLSFGGHLLLSLAVAASPTAVRYLGGDALTYHQGAVAIVEHWRGGDPFPLLPSGKEGFFYTLAALYSVFGFHAVGGLALNAAFSAVLVPVTYDTTRRLVGPEAARAVIPLTVVLPGFLIFTAQLLREAGVLLMMAVAANCAVRLSERVRIGAIGAMAFSLAALFTYRGNVATMMVIGLTIGMLIGGTRVLTGLSVSATIVGLVALLVVAVGIGYSGYRISTEADLRTASLIRLDSSRSATSGFASDADISTPDRALTFLPGALVQFALGPFPWQVGGVRHLPAVIDMVCIWALLPSIWRGLAAARLRVGRQAFILVFPAVLVSVMLALLIGNFGTIVRERLQVIVLLAPFVGLGLAQRRRPEAEEERPGAGDQALASAGAAAGSAGR
jgi:hypothetical protein